MAQLYVLNMQLEVAAVQQRLKLFLYKLFVVYSGWNGKCCRSIKQER